MRVASVSMAVLSMAFMTCGPAAAQTGLPPVVFPGHAGIGADFGGYKPPAAPWSVSHGKANRFDRLYLPGDPIELTVELRNDGPSPLALSGTWRWAWVGDVAGDEKGGVAYRAAAVESERPLGRTAIEPRAAAAVRFAFKAPQRHGVLALFLDASDGTTAAHRWVTNVAVVFPAAKGPRADSMFFGDTRGTRNWQRKLELPVMQRLGVKWVRSGADWGRVEPKKGQWEWRELDEEMNALREHGMLSVFLGGPGADWTRAYGKLSWPRENPNKFSSSPDPSHYGDFAEYWRQVAARYKDVVRAVNVWNEPWEAGGISNWGGTGAHYRDLQRVAKLGVARADPTLLVGGNDSDNNVVDNLLCDPSWQTYTDLITVHGSEFPNQHVHRRVPDGMPVWNTEMWYTAQTDRTVQTQLFELMRGVTKTNLVILGNFFSAGYKSGGYYDPKDPKAVPDLVPQPNAAGYSAMAHFLEGTKLVAEPAPDRLPYALLMRRAEKSTGAAAHEWVLVLVGQAVNVADQLWWQCAAGPDGRATLPRPAGVTGVFDRYGNPIGGDTIPFNTEPVYVTADAAEPLRAALAGLRVTRHARPLHVGLIDPGADGRVGARITNPLPQATTFALKADASEVRGELAAGETKDVPLGVTVDKATAIELAVTTPLGAFAHSETVTPRIIRRLTPTLDGDPAEWLAAGAVPVNVTDDGGGAAQSAAAAMPWEALATAPGAKPAGRFALAYDDRHLYVFAEIRTPKRPELPFDQSRPDWYELHPGAYSYKRAPEWPFTGENVQLAIDCADNPADAIYPPDDPRQRRYPKYATDYLFGFYATRQGGTQAWLYRRPGGPFRHRYPFTPAAAVDQGVAPGVRLVVTRDDASGTTRYEAAIPLGLLPEVDARPGGGLPGADVKLTVGRWNGLYSAAGRGAAQRDQSVFQPYWMPGYTTTLPWSFE